MTTPSVDLAVVRRQTFGGMYSRNYRDRAIADDVLHGAVTLRPHPEWKIQGEINWEADPFGQRNWQAQLHMLRWLEPVRRVALDGDGKARDFWLRTCKSWVSANPPAEPKVDESYRFVSYAWTDMVDAVRALVLTFGLPLREPGRDRWLDESIYEHGLWLSDPKHLGHSNHALHQHQALFVLGSVFNKHDWTTLAVDRMTALFEASYDEQGVNLEGAIGYHKNNLIWWEEAFKRLDLEGTPRPFSAARLDLARLELAHATRPDGTLEVIGDTGPGGLGGLSSPELDYVKSQGGAGQPPEALTKVYDRGYIFGRSGWGDHERSFRDETFYSLSFGKANRVHGHRDGGALTLHAGGCSWLIDSGKYAYAQDEMRDYCVSRLGHNVVHVQGRPYDRTAEVVLTHRATSAEVDDFKFQDAGYEGVDIQRRVVYCRGGDFFLVVDTVLSKEEVVASQRWHLNPGTEIEQTAGGYRLAQGSNAAWLQWRGNMPTLSIAEGSEAPFDGWMSDDWMVRRASPVISASQTGKRFRFITIVATPRSGQFSLKSLTATPGRIDLSATVGRNQFNLAVEEGQATVSLGEEGAGTSSDIKAAWLATTELCRMADLRRRVPKPADDIFSTHYWGLAKAWIRQQPEGRAARLEILSILLSLLLRGSNSPDDQGLRAAIIDVMGSDLGREVGLTAGALGVNREPLIAWNDGSKLHSPTYKRRIRTVDSPADIVLSGDRSSEIFSASVGGLVLPFAVGRGSSGLLSVRFHGAVNRQKTTLPFFQGLTAEASGDDSFALFQDPSLDLNKIMTLAWYLGDGHADVHRYIAECIMKLRSELNLKNVLLSGSSGGGFAALQVASYLPECVALVFNPQTDVRAYYPNSSEIALTSCLNERVAGPSSSEKMVSVVAKYASLTALPRVLYVQNSGDKHHVVHHRDPFRRMLESEHPGYAGRISFFDVDWGSGHVAATGDMQSRYRAHAVTLFQD